MAQGYLHQPALTASKFIPNPFASEPGGRLYCSGDLVRYRQNGLLVFIGRRDFQVKVHGFRIEPAEIENALVEHALVSEAIVVPKPDSQGKRQLIAYIVGPTMHETPDPGVVGSDLTPILQS